MFGFGQDQISSIDQLQRRLRLSDIGLEQSPAAQMLLEDAGIIKVSHASITVHVVPGNQALLPGLASNLYMPNRTLCILCISQQSLDKGAELAFQCKYSPTGMQTAQSNAHNHMPYVDVAEAGR